MKRIILLSMLLLASLGIAGRSSAQGSQPTPFDSSGDVTEPIFITTPITSFGDSGSIDIAPEGGSVSLYFQVDSPLASGNILDCFTNVGDQKVEHLFSDVSLPEYTGNVEGNLELTLVENVSGLTRTIVIASRTNEVTLVQLPRSSAVYQFSGTPGVIYPTQQAVFTLSGSDRFATYELFRDGQYVEMIQGTGRSLRYEISALAGTYSVLSQPLDVSMNGSVTLTLHPSFATAYPLTLASLTFPADGGKVSVGFTRTLTATEQARLTEAVAALNSGRIATWDSENMIVTYAGGALTVGCRPNLTSQARSYNSHLRTTSGATLSASQPAGGKLYAYDIRYDSLQHCVWLSGSQYGVTYVLHCNGEQTGVPAMGTGAAISLRVPDEGTYTVQGRVGYERIDMNGSVVVTESRATPTEGTNYILTATYTAECAQEKVEDITYYDGLGYPEQVIRIGATGNGGNIVEPIVYDSMRRADARVYLPYAVAGTSAERIDDPLSAQAAYYTSVYGAGEAAYAYREKVYERSALDRPLAALNAGAAFRGEQEHRSEFSYGTNSSAQVLRLRVTATGTLVGNGYYPASVLRKQTVIDEDSARTERFTDAQDRLVLERRLLAPAQHADTYHVYDDYGRLAWVVSPEGSGLLTTSSSWTIDCDNARKYCYRYTYDGRGRQIERRLPGREAEYMVYDPAGRLVATQDGNLREQNKWFFTRYDSLNRPVRTFLLTTAQSASSLRSAFASKAYPSILDSAGEELSLTVYDSYPSTAAPFVAVAGIAERYDERTGGRKTWERIAALGTDAHLTRTYYYDTRGRVVQTLESHSTGGTLQSSTRYDFTGNVLTSSERYRQGTIDDCLTRTFTYDPRGRLLAETSRVNTGPTARLFYTYDDLGKLTGKTYGQTLTPVTESLTYNIQGWRTGQQVNKGSDYLFSTSIRYYDSYLGSEPSYTGNISSWTWGYDNQLAASYVFEYDKLARLIDVDHYIGNSLENMFVEKGMSYDRNSNLLTLQRYDSSVRTADLSFTYSGNRRTGYGYDANGNIVKDATENLQITYNFLNLPSVIKRGAAVKALYSYYADGSKSRVIDASGTGYDYIGSFKYARKGNTLTLESAAASGGRIHKTAKGYEVRYHIADHLGSVRLVTSASGTILEQNDYHPYGTRHANAGHATTPNPYLYGGKELQQDFGVNYYDSHARFQTNSGIFLSIDPLSEQMPGVSPYAYCGGNPIGFVDPNGEEPGHYYDYNGNYVASDGIDDDKLYLVDDKTVEAYKNEKDASNDDAMATRTLKKGAEEVDGLIVVTRTHETTEYTQGEFQALGKEGFEGYTMERPGPPTYESGKRKPIPTGLYNTEIRKEGDFAGGFAFRIFNNRVSKNRGILGHIGNRASDSQGCILFGLGLSDDEKSISNSKIAMQKFQIYYNTNKNNILIIR